MSLATIKTTILVRPKQINHRELFSVKDILNSRGFIVTEVGLNENLLIKQFTWPSPESNLLFEVFDNKNNRKEIFNLLNREISEPHSDLVSALTKAEGYCLERNRITATFEWYIGELLTRKFSAFSYDYGVVVSNIRRNSSGTEAGDYDVIAVLRNTNLLYVECKAGRAQNIEQKHILKCVERALALHCELSIIVIDDVIDEERLKDSLKGAKHPLTNVNFLNKLQIKNNADSSIYEWMNCYFISSVQNVEEQMRAVLRINEARKVSGQYTSGMGDGAYDSFGYEISELQRC